MKKGNIEDGLVTPQDLARKTGVTIHQINDYIRRHLLKVSKYDKHTRCLANPPSADIVRFVTRHVEKSGNLRGCEELLRAKYPEYYGRT
jgi:hypothetical protein